MDNSGEYHLRASETALDHAALDATAAPDADAEDGGDAGPRYPAPTRASWLAFS